eukprot:scaffold281980_cov17-Tisochrysis_lutea.AAC.1
MSSPSPCLFQVLANAASKLNTPPKGGKGTVSKLSPTKIGGVVTKKPASRTSPAKLGGVVASSTRASVHSKMYFAAGVCSLNSIDTCA